MSERTCRICRGEATPSQPLLHPCKCRGSIKYTHQDCLLEWLKHSNKSTSKCDICNTPYKFITIYDPDMPDRIPAKFIWEKFVSMVSGTVIRVMSVLLYTICIFVQIPIYWKFIGRIYTWAIDGHLPQANPSFFDALLFGEFEFTEAVASMVDRAYWDILYFKVSKFFEYTYAPGLRYVLICIISHIALFIEHEWVVRDEGFNKLLLKEVGKEPRVKLMEVLEQALTAMENEQQTGGRQGGAGANNEVNAEMMARALRDLEQGRQNGNGVPEEGLRRFIEEQRGANANVNDANLNWNRFEQQRPEVREGENDPLLPRGDEVAQDFAFNFGDNDLDASDNDDIADDVVPEVQPHARARFVPHAPRINLFENEDDDDDEDEDDEDENNADIDGIAAAADAEADAEAAEAAAAGNGDILDILGINLNNLRTPIMLMIVGNSIISVYLFVAYLIPHMIGNFVTSALGYVFRITGSKVVGYIPEVIISFISSTVPSYIESICQFHPFVTTFTRFLFTGVIQPIIVIIDHLFDPQFMYPAVMERSILVTIGYCVLSLVIYKLMKSIASGSNKKPVMGTPRKIYKLLFEISSTTKVFIVFAIEIFIFPVYCGWLLDFCLAPVLLDRFTAPNGVDIASILATSLLHSVPFLDDTAFGKIMLYWVSGTLYMLFFALFVGMVRDKILRPGVLFFIRSPDDPNARLIHDALVKPLSLQLSRIYLSAKVYTGFILVGIGGVTWLLRYCFQEANYNVVLPLQIPYDFKSLAIYFVLIGSLHDKDLYIRYSKLYWGKVFEISTHNLRLSHFIIGKLVPQERGFIAYRNVWEQILGRSLPDYSKPVTYRDALKNFQEDKDLKACFVPDGNYVRVPDNDTVSRKYIKKLFVAVTKDDKLLSQKQPQSEQDQEDNPDDDSTDDEMTTNNAYTIVYRPPNFKMRCFGLIVMLWVFAVLLILIIAFTSLLLGRPIVRAFYIIVDVLGSSASQNFDFRLADLKSLLVGFNVQLVLLRLWDKAQNNNDGNEVLRDARRGMGAGEQQDVGGAAVEGGNIPGVGRIGGFLNFNPLNFADAAGNNNIAARVVQFIAVASVHIVTFSLWMLWIGSIHKICIDLPIRAFIFKNGEPQSYIQSVRFTINSFKNEILISNLSIVIHLFVSMFTVLPFCKIQFKFMRDVIAGGPHINEASYLWKKNIKPVCINILLTFPTIVAILCEIVWKFDDQTQKLYIHPYLSSLNLLGFIIYRFVSGVMRLLKKINIKVKNEKYVKGKAIENFGDED
ncbi:ERAD-associated E3 ubiquitin-protein ligase DOA10 [[Candida] railenensis]|uniref:RING-type E3 ubiquitin transferase n=1 Tax=[Candida] railenensis TaxID=45579 RepID=A0A9P0QQH0_9ASCO|nr:ERAD-associated E3 ubiquitin-protein ligase DOA10 [[Candida] railenensis]